MLIDFHSHILPGIDDGSASVEESIALLEMEAKQGVTHVVATPHFYAQHDSPENFLRRRAEAKALLDEKLKKHPGLPEISLGAEVYFFHGISDSELLPELTIDNKRFILIEMPFAHWTDSMYSELEAIARQRGITPIVAHVDRYITPLNNHGIPKKLSGLPVLVQANAGSFIKGGFMSSMMMKLLKKDKVHLIGSDCHNITSRPPKIGQAMDAIERKLGNETVERILECGKNILDV